MSRTCLALVCHVAAELLHGLRGLLADLKEEVLHNISDVAGKVFTEERWKEQWRRSEICRLSWCCYGGLLALGWLVERSAGCAVVWGEWPDRAFHASGSPKPLLGFTLGKGVRSWPGLAEIDG